MASLYRCIFEWDQQDLDSLYAAKRQELIANGIKNPSSEAVRRAVGKKELALHSRRRTRGAEATENLLDSLLTTMAPATECWVYPCSERRCWARFGQNKRNMSPAYDPPPEYNCTFALAAAPRVANPSRYIDVHVEPPLWKVSTIIWQDPYQASLT